MPTFDLAAMVHRTVALALIAMLAVAVAVAGVGYRIGLLPAAPLHWSSAPQAHPTPPAQLPVRWITPSRSTRAVESATSRAVHTLGDHAGRDAAARSRSWARSRSLVDPAALDVVDPTADWSWPLPDRIVSNGADR